MTYLEDLNKLYNLCADTKDKKVFIGEWIFELATYDDEITKVMVDDILDVFNAIKNNTTFEYIKENYTKYLNALNLGNCIQWVDWGTSIRGAWFRPSATIDFQSSKHPINAEELYDAVIEFLK